MDARGLIETLKTRGLTLRVNGDRIRIEASQEPDSETKALLDEVRQHKAEVLEALTQETPSEALAASILAENKPDEVARILAFWRGLGIKDLDGRRAREGLEPMGEHLAHLRSWKSKRRFRDGRE